MRVVSPILLAVLCASVPCNIARAESGSLFSQGNWGGARGGLIATPALSRDSKGTPSLFVGRAAAGLFAERPAHEPAFDTASPVLAQGSDVARLRALIGAAESRRDGYEAVQHGARVKTPKPPTQMTLAEIYRWIGQTPGQPHAIGRYQFIPATLRRVVAKLGIAPNTRFSPAVQDRLADVLLAEAGLHEFRAGRLGRVAFMNNLAKIWAGLPNVTGKSHYHGYAGNRASITWARFDAEMARIDPAVIAGHGVE
ncbi:hypothetical protein O4H53_18395 [Sulfitobacter sp. G21635-S1]|uniref:hypothetical protein n=1 Tax=Sulfitobacter sp. G21635-S1 TaxID=3014043 RepID=UPI0022AEE416|nr:hypothetical protein [Sulfitobacter sp. G21635-S1]MCZ4257526.1 hypothetical protein [Sulfitobacter sp. G21635-S1]